MNYMKIKKIHHHSQKEAFQYWAKEVFFKETSPEEEQIQVSTICRNSTKTITEKKTKKKKKQKPKKLGRTNKITYSPLMTGGRPNWFEM